MNQSESPEIDPYENSQLTRDKGIKVINQRKACLQKMMLEQLDIPMLKEKKNPDTDFVPFTKMNSEWIIDK